MLKAGTKEKESRQLRLLFFWNSKDGGDGIDQSWLNWI